MTRRVNKYKHEYSKFAADPIFATSVHSSIPLDASPLANRTSPVKVTQLPFQATESDMEMNIIDNVDISTQRRLTRSMTSTTRNSSSSSDTLSTSLRLSSSNLKRRRDVAKQEKEEEVRRRRPQAGQSRHIFPSLDANTFGLIQESIAHNLYHLCIQAMLWNQTSGRQAKPVFFKLIELYPTPAHLAGASLPALTALLQPLGLHNIRAKRCILFAQKWLELPPVAGKTYTRKGYPGPGSEEGFEIAHLPGMGPYALDSFRIFHRDEMRGLASSWLGEGSDEGFEPEWIRVVPLDKELKAYVKWQWLRKGQLGTDVGDIQLSASIKEE